MSYSKIFEIDQDIDPKVKNFMIDFILELKKKGVPFRYNENQNGFCDITETKDTIRNKSL